MMVMELSTMQVQRKSKDISTLDAQEEMYERRLQEHEWNKGLTVQEILDKVNDPSRFTSRTRR